MNSKAISPEKIELRKKFPPTYGRRKSRSLTESQKNTMINLYPQLKVEPDKAEIKKFSQEIKNKEVFLEIGFGDGEHLVHQAQNNPDKILLGCELYINSFVVCLQSIKREKIQNIRLYNNDSRYLLEVLPHNSVDKVFILFPDPWPKQKQFKRRIVSPLTLDLLYPLLKQGGVIRLATDIDSYFEQMLNVFSRDKRFKLLTKEKDFVKMPKDHTQTHYQRKAIREGRQPRFIEYSKI